MERARTDLISIVDTTILFIAVFSSPLSTSHFMVAMFYLLGISQLFYLLMDG